MKDLTDALKRGMKTVCVKIPGGGGYNFAFALAACFSLTAVATEWHVYSDTRDGLTGNQQLTNAFTRAVSGDTITIHEGTYNLATEELMFRYETDTAGTQHATAGTCLLSAADNLTVRGDPSVSRDAIVLSGLGANASSQDGQHAIMRLTGANCTVQHLTFYKGKADSNFSIYQNGVLKNNDKWTYRRGGGLNLSLTSVCSDCTFDSCYAGQGACLYSAAAARGCVFKSSNAVESNAGGAVCYVTAIYDSEFTDNARGAVRSCSGTISNCVFSANRHIGSNGLFYYQTGSVIDCAFSNNTTVCLYLHGAQYMPKEITGCTFAYNRDTTYTSSAAIGGTVSCTVPVTDCTFVGPNQLNGFPQKISRCKFIREQNSAVSVLADCPQVYDCEFYGTLPVDSKILEAGASTYVSVVTNCSLYRCHIHDFNIRYGNVLTDVRRMENCLVDTTVLWGRSASDTTGDACGTFRFTDGQDAAIVNCTFTTNQSNAAFVNPGGGTITFKNTLFFNNKVGGRAWAYWDFETGNDTIVMDHSVYKAAADMAGTGSQNWYGTSNKPQFLKDLTPGADVAHPYALYRKSPLIDAGDDGDWTAADVDLAGAKRLNRAVDIGCYENWDVVPKLTIILR